MNPGEAAEDGSNACISATLTGYLAGVTHWMSSGKRSSGYKRYISTSLLLFFFWVGEINIFKNAIWVSHMGGSRSPTTWTVATVAFSVHKQQAGPEQEVVFHWVHMSLHLSLATRSNACLHLIYMIYLQSNLYIICVPLGVPILKVWRSFWKYYRSLALFFNCSLHEVFSFE